MANSEIIEEITASSDSIEEIIEEITASSDSIEEIRASSDSTKALRSSPSANHHQNGAPPPSFETICNDLRLVNLAWKKYTAHMNAKIYVAGKEFKRLLNLGCIEEGFDELHNAIKNLESEIPLTSNEDDHERQMIGSEPDRLDSAFAEVQKFMKSTREKIKCSIRSLVLNFKAKQVENHHQNEASSSATTDRHASSSEKITHDLRRLNSAWKKYMDHTNAQINMASEEFKKLRRKYPFPDRTNAQNNIESEECEKLQNLASIEKHFDKLQKAVKNLKSQVKKWQIRLTSKEDDHDGGALSDMIKSDLDLLGSDFGKAQKLMKTNFEKLQKVIEKLKSQVKELQSPLTSNEDDHDGGDLFQMIERGLNHLVSAFAEVPKFKETDFDELQKAIEKLKSKVKELQIPLTSNEDDPDGGTRFQMIERDLNHLASYFPEVPKFKETDFDEFQKAIEKLKSKLKELQIPLTSNEEDCDGGDLFQMIERDLDLLRSAWEEARKFMESTKWDIDQAQAKFNKLRKPNSEEQQKSESYKLRTDIVKLRVRIHSYREIRSTTDSNRHRYDWPNINGVKDGMMHFFFEESNLPNKKRVGDGMMDFNKLPEPVLSCLLCFFKFPPDAFIRRTTMIYLWIGQGYILKHLQKKYPLEVKEELIRQGYILQHMQEQYASEEHAGKKIFDALITNGFIERSSLEPNSCKMNPSARSSLYKAAEDKGFTPNGTRDLDAESVRVKQIGHSCLINVGEAIVNCTFEIFEKMEDIHSLYFGRWQTSATHHIELLDTKILDGMSKLNSLTFLSLRGISLITELPTFIFKLNNLKILDLRACHNLEKIPDEISSLEKLTHLDMSECYFLERMPKSLARLLKLEVLKGFFIGDSKNNKQSCTLSDLSQLSKLRKLNIYTSVEKFPTTSNLQALQKFQGLLKLTISWGGCSLPGKTGDTAASASQEEGEGEGEGEGTLHLRLQKLDLQGFPLSSLPCWLWPSNLKDLRKLYIRGGNLCDLEQSLENQGEHWNVEILRLKYLDALEMDWSKLMRLFPKLIYLQQKECSKFNFQGYERSVWPEWEGKENSTVWMHKKAIDTRFWLQKLFSSDVNSINLSSLLGYKQKIAQHNSNTSSRSETALVN